MTYTFRTLGAWAMAVREQRARLYPPWVHLDYFWRVYRGETACLIVQGSASVNGETWAAEVRLGLCAAGHEEGTDALIGRVHLAMNPAIKLLTDANVLILEGFLPSHGKEVECGSL